MEIVMPMYPGLAHRTSPDVAVDKRTFEKEVAIHSSVLAWRIPGMGEPGGLLSMGSHRVRQD